ncbi:uncharacterized protein [Porites lutea]|uniref:uncharacterized protein n=1 Tax=Porites lutea TaxID=51062 RepID=UPI003CC5A3CF
MVSAVANGYEHSSFASPVALKEVEDKIRKAVHARNVRLTEYFKDFDRLRTGFITKTQFDRCLDQLFGIVLSPEDDAKLMEKYGSPDPKRRGMVSYRKFCEVIGAVFNPDILGQDPATQKIGPAASNNTVDRRPLSPASLSKCENLLMRLAQFYKYHGINIKTCYADFDKHHIGVVTESQFYRSFPGSPDVTAEETVLLAKKYRDHTRPGLCNYYSFHEDIERKQNDLAEQEDFTKYIPIQDFIDDNRRRPGTPTLHEIFEKIRLAIHKHGIRTTEFFKDHDKLRSGEITENQFICGLSLCCGTQAHLSRDEIQKVVDVYRQPDGRVRYKEFCDIMENAFTVPDLEKKPTADVYRPPTGALTKAPNLLSPEEENRVNEVLKGFAETVRKRRLMAYPYFKDFDRSKGYTRGVTKTQFARMLHFLSINVQPQDLALLCKKFEYPVGGDINYSAFIQAIDSEYTGTATTISDFALKDKSSSENEEPRPLDLSSVDRQELIDRVKHYVLVNRLRVEEYFQDFDPLRHGSISRSQFRRCLSSMGQPNLTDEQFEVLAQYYKDPKILGNVMWTRFLTDTEMVFTRRGLEKAPTYEVPSMETFQMSRPGAGSDRLSMEDEEFLQRITQRMRRKLIEQRILSKPCFQDFDKHNNGHVTKIQASQCLHTLGLTDDPEEIKILQSRYSDDIGFNYIQFLEDLQPSEKPEMKYLQRLEELKLTNQKHLPDLGDNNFEKIMYKIKCKVMKERMRLNEFFKDYDKLRTGRILKTLFPRAMDLSSLKLTKVEVEQLMERYTAFGYPDYVNYTAFVEEIESIFTLNNLEKAPLVVPVQFRPNLEGEDNKLTTEEERLLEIVMHRLADRVRIRRIQIFPLFEDYDRVHNGTVSQFQFHRVLSELDLGSLVSAREFLVIKKKFLVVLGYKHDFNYIGFCDMVNDFANFEFGKP